MSQIPLQHRSDRSTAATAFGALVVCEAIVFLVAATLHTGAFTVPQLIPAMIVEGLCGIGCVICAYVVLTRKASALTTAIIVHILAIAGVLLGIVALSRSPGLRTPTNVMLHAMMLVLIVLALSLLTIPGMRASLSGGLSSRVGKQE